MLTIKQSSCFLANVLVLCAIVVFATGFFPHKAFKAGLADFPPGPHSSSRVPAQFDKVIFMVVDALRSDLVFGPASNFSFTQSLIRSGAALPFTGHASPPTITMPRVKAITTGSVPSFLDVVLNFAESDESGSLAAQDTWLAQIRRRYHGSADDMEAHSKLVMYGDDTWLRLFPGFFERSDGTTSFFVSDFTEVDNNVTRHLPEELGKADWQAMILHYLGLDHIGHKTGPNSPHMPAKQKEMDSIVQQMYEAIESREHLKSTLLVLTGDHGMNEAGNHGGSSAGEVSTALVFISPKLETSFSGFQSPVTADGYDFYETIEQSDIAPTLAALMQFPVPQNNLGVLIPQFLGMWTEESDQKDLLFANAYQLAQLAEMTYHDSIAGGAEKPTTHNSHSSEAEHLHRMFKDVQRARYGGPKPNSIPAIEAIPIYLSFLRTAQTMLSGTASNFDLRSMFLGIGLAGSGTVLAGVPVMTELESIGVGTIGLMSMAISYGITMFASSFVEEEQQFWYWMVAGWFAVTQSKHVRRETGDGVLNTLCVSAVAVLFGILRHWNQTGQKWVGDPDLSSAVFSQYPWILWGLVMYTYALISRRISARATKWGQSSQFGVIAVLLSMVAFAFKISFTAADAPELVQSFGILEPLLLLTREISLVNLARVVYLGIGYLFACATFYQAPWQNDADMRGYLFALHDLLSLFLVTQSRATNIPIFLLFYWQLGALQRDAALSGKDVTMTSLLMQYSSFFVFGGSNAISSVDLSNAYNGISGYNVGAVGLLTFLSNWAGPVWWTSATALLMSTRPAICGRPHAAFDNFAHMTLFVSFGTLAVMVACMALREHLFIWTVFSPKYLFNVAWTAGHHVVINGVLGYGLLGRLIACKPLAA